MLIRRTRKSEEDACLEYGVSPAMLHFRSNVSVWMWKCGEREGVRHNRRDADEFPGFKATMFVSPECNLLLVTHLGKPLRLSKKRSRFRAPNCTSACCRSLKSCSKLA